MTHALPVSWMIESDDGMVTVALDFDDRTVTLSDPSDDSEVWYYPFSLAGALGDALRQARDTLIELGEHH